MYLAHFGLREPPFALTPDTSFFCNRGSHHEALNVLMVALRSGEGFIKITGEVGTGKTLLCRQLLNSLDDSHYSAYIPNPFLGANALRMALADELGIAYQRNAGQHRLSQQLNARLVELAREGKRTVLLVDEVQAMPAETLEALRLLSNLETETHKLLQLVIFGQPELDQRLAEPGLRQLRSRIAFSHRLRPLDRAGLADYLRYRLQAAGYQGEPLFEPRAEGLLLRGSRGIPRLVNILAHKALMAAFGEGRSRVRAAHVRRAIIDTDDASPAGWFARLGWSR
ncbi:ExeA family protein [Alkalilimnicola sp. S0819]|uniref:ExeA family protein n=1 Tax=Alkalilimnicola sp. S0819 TaxID=2613922 RepID=UPI0012615A35|nr:AAA family ATPase [Alkalilimnicola sp. S0819]KAB7622640.1 AAA family ATPase [Alkalilimnicola sp. S0819]MPQ17411.1 AAA family ATPase [Alkalilimnicola sp. S0819]